MNNQVNLSKFKNTGYDPGRGAVIRALWFCVNVVVLRNPLNPSSMLRVWALRLFGAIVGRGVVLKPGLSIKYPWNVQVGDHSWIGENVWLDSLTTVKIDNNVCISQGAYLCTGNHDWTDPAFGLIVEPIAIHDGAWISARAVVLPGTVVEWNVVITAGSVISGSTAPNGVYTGNPAILVKQRTIREASAP